MSAVRILLVNHEQNESVCIKSVLEETGRYCVETANSAEEALEKMGRGPCPGLIVLDLLMPGLEGLRALESCKKNHPKQKIVVMSGEGDTEKVVQAIRLGASDYINKPFRPEQLQETVRRALMAVPPISEDSARPVPRTDELIENLDEDVFFLAVSPVMKQIRSQVDFIAKVDVPVLLLGESGVGKEIMARVIHKISPRAARPLVKVNCAALPAELLESELFGYESGAFTGAGKSKPGKFELAHKGTILLDEIGEMSAALQAKLLHVLQDGQFSRLGGRMNIQVDARILAATNIDVQKAIAERQLREDLYYRLNAFTITIPPLRERREEIPILLSCFMERFSQKFAKNPLQVSDRMMKECLRYDWPGNLRELGNFVKRYLVMEEEGQLIEELRTRCTRPDGGANDAALPAAAQTGLKALVRNVTQDAEAKEILRALENEGWNRTMAATRLRISYKALLYKIKQHGLTPPPPTQRESRLTAM